MFSSEWIVIQLQTALTIAIQNLVWIVFGGTALAFLTWGPLGKALRRLSKSRTEELTLLQKAVKALESHGHSIEQVHERLDYVERGLHVGDSQRLPRPENESMPTPH